MGVDQTRCDKPVRTVHNLIALGDFNGFPAFHRLDAVVLHQDHLIGIHPLFYCVEQFPQSIACFMGILLLPSGRVGAGASPRLNME